MKSISKSLLSLSLLLLAGAVSAAPPDETTNKLAKADPAILCYAETNARPDDLSLIKIEIERRDLKCTPEMISIGQKKFEKGRAAAAKRVPGQPARSDCLTDDKGRTINCKDGQ
jgi:hypothetical protein